jgi:hypothetical protein
MHEGARERRETRSRATEAHAGRAVLGPVAAAGLVVAMVAACSGGKSQSLPEQFDASQLDCLVSLAGECCPTASARPLCIATFAEAKECASWPVGATLTLFPAACQGMTAVRAVLPGETFDRFYVYDGTGALYAIGDNAASPDPRSGAIECGAGPTGFVIPTACADAWLGAQGSQACGSGATTVTSICQ